MDVSDAEDRVKKQCVSSTEMQPLKPLTSPHVVSSSSNPLGDLSPLLVLPLEIMEEILCRVPAKALSQVRCVCKYWNSIISNPKFAKKHLSWSSENSTGHRLIFNTSRSREFFELALEHSSLYNDSMRIDQLFNRYDLIVGSCDGILCITVNKQDVSLWNPAIKKSKQLPTLIFPPRDSSALTKLSFTTYGFGYDHIAGSYKVVAVFGCMGAQNYFGNPEPARASVHTLGTNSWRRIEDFPLTPEEESGKLVSGTLNWLTDGFGNHLRSIISFDLVNERCLELRQPDYEEDAKVTLGVLKGYLCIFSNAPNFIGVWIMNELGNERSWTKLFKFPEEISFEPDTKIFYIYEDDEVLLEWKSHAIVYNYKNDIFRCPKPEIGSKILDGLIPQRYIESLISPCV